MSKLRITITYVCEFEPDAACYHGASTLEEMLAIDLDAARDYPGIFLDMSDSTITGEVVREGEV